jgi:quercetin dioxygenase-like cupin family protein
MLVAKGVEKMTFRRVMTTPDGPTASTEDVLKWGPQGVHAGLTRIQVSQRPVGDPVWAIVSFAPGTEVGLHIRPTEHNYIFMLQGEMDLLLAGEAVVPLRAGDCLHIQRGTMHGWRVTSAEPAVNMSVRFTDRSGVAEPSYTSADYARLPRKGA